MDLKQLEYFVHVAELGSFTRASHVLNIAQPALSRQIRLLEVELAQNLLVRNGRGVTLTPSGKLLLEHGQGVLYQVTRLREEMGRSRGALVGRVALGLPPSLVKILTVEISKKFKAELPEAVLSIREGLTVSMQEALLNGQLDVALLYNAAHTPDIEQIPLLNETLYFVAPLPKEAHSSKRAQTITLKELASQPLIIPSRPNVTRILIEKELAEQNLQANITLEIDGISAILQLVSEGLGFAVLSKNAVDSLAATHQFWLRRIVAPKLQYKLSLAVSARRQISATQQALMNMVQNLVQQRIADKENK